MPNNMILLETIALTQSAASVTFDNLPTSGYTDLKIVVSARTNGATFNNYFEIRPNGATTNLSGRYLQGDGSGVNSGSFQPWAYVPPSGSTANTFGSIDIYIPNYSSTSTNKSLSIDYVTENNATEAFAGIEAGLWASNSAITSVSLVMASTNLFVANSTFSLYGIAALGTTPVLAPKATGGNIVANDGTYWYHAFTSSGYFVPQVGLTADVLVVAGGGGGGELGGGGGAGGLLAYTSQSLTNGQNYYCTIGAGGAGQAGTNGSNGVNSQFASLTASVGGGGGGRYDQAGSNGGSGGGAGRNYLSAATGTLGQGNNGGIGLNGYNYSAAGGGGSGAVGSNAVNGAGGAGGAGVNTYSSWLSATSLGVSGYIAGGGGGGYYYGIGGAGGSGGGGAGSSNTVVGTAGTANTGSGGGGNGGGGAAGGAGGSGIILIRYPIA